MNTILSLISYRYFDIVSLLWRLFLCLDLVSFLNTNFLARVLNFDLLLWRYLVLWLTDRNFTIDSLVHSSCNFTRANFTLSSLLNQIVCRSVTCNSCLYIYVQELFSSHTGPIITLFHNSILVFLIWDSKGVDIGYQYFKVGPEYISPGMKVVRYHIVVKLGYQVSKEALINITI